MAEECSSLSSFLILFNFFFFQTLSWAQLPGGGLFSLQTALPVFASKVFPPVQRLLVAFFFFSGGLPSLPHVGLSGGRFPCDKNIFLGRTLSHPGKTILTQGILQSLTSRGIPSPARKGRILCHSSEANFEKLWARKQRLKVLSWFLSALAVY